MTTTSPSPINATTSPDLLADAYIACWNTTDPAERRRLVEQVWAADARNSDPMFEVQGHDQLCEMFAAFHTNYAGHSFRRTGGVDRHHQLLRWGWEMVDPDGNLVLDGMDAALLDESGRLSYVAGFFGLALPAG